MKRANLKYLMLAGMASGLLAFTAPQEGSITGTVIPVEATATVWTLVGTDTVKAEADAMSGAFELTGIPAGDYSIHVDGVDPYVDATVDVTVEEGQAADLGEVELQEAEVETTLPMPTEPAPVPTEPVPAEPTPDPIPQS